MTFYTNRKQMIIAPQSVINTKKKSGKSLSYMTPILLNSATRFFILNS